MQTAMATAQRGSPRPQMANGMLGIPQSNGPALSGPAPTGSPVFATQQGATTPTHGASASPASGWYSGSPRIDVAYHTPGTDDDDDEEL